MRLLNYYRKALDKLNKLTQDCLLCIVCIDYVRGICHNEIMKKKFILSLWLIIFSPLMGHMGHASSLNVEPGTWWEIQLSMTSSGNYRYYYNEVITGEYSFKLVSNASIEQDNSGDYILYQGSEQVSIINWSEKSAVKGTEKGTEKEDSTVSSSDLSKILSPSMRLNYVIKKDGELYFDFDVFLKNPPPDKAHPFNQFLLPRSALNQGINPKDKYNKYVRSGANEVKIAEKLFLKQLETGKSFRWEWQRDNPDFFNFHSVDLELKIIKKSPEK